MTAFPHLLERTVDIGATVDTVFEYFTDSALWAAWWGTGSAIDARPGGRMLIRHNNGVEVTGEVLEVDPPRRIVFTYGYATGTQLPQGRAGRRSRSRSSRRARRRGCTCGTPSPRSRTRDPHVQGWRYQLSVFATTIADRLHAGAGDTADAWFAAWSDPEAATREATVGRIAAPAIRFRDRYSLVTGLEDLHAHLAAVHRFMPGMRIERVGAVRHCQGVAVVDWVARGADGAERGRGQNVFTLGGDGRIVDVVGLWT